jgi:hypothetical protein
VIGDAKLVEPRVSAPDSDRKLVSAALCAVSIAKFGRVQAEERLRAECGTVIAAEATHIAERSAIARRAGEAERATSEESGERTKKTFT